MTLGGPPLGGLPRVVRGEVASHESYMLCHRASSRLRVTHNDTAGYLHVLPVAVLDRVRYGGPGTHGVGEGDVDRI